MSRKSALNALTQMRRNNKHLDKVLLTITQNMDARDAAFVTWLSYGVVQNIKLLDYFIAQKSTIKLNKIEPNVLDALRLGTIQLYMSNNIPKSAAVNETVKLVPQRAKRFTNAVMRRLSESDFELPDDLPTRYSMPKWFIDELSERLNETECEELCSKLNSIPKTTVQFVSIEKEALRVEMQRFGITVTDHELYEECLQIDSAAKLTELPSWKENNLWVSDVGAMLAIEAAEISPGMRILDACAAPGGKTLAILRKLQNKGEVIACDIDEEKVNRLKKRVPCEVRLQSALDFKPEWENSFDVVVCDLPCSGMGIIAKKPDIRNKSREDIAHLPQMQLKMLQNLMRYVKPGGKLLYITCTLVKAENEDVMAQLTQEFTSKTLWPHKYNTDGFFYAITTKPNN